MTKTNTTTPSRPTSTLKKQGSSVASSKNQSSILGFFSKTPNNVTLPVLKKEIKTEGSPATLAEASATKTNGTTNSKATPTPTAKKSFLKKASAQNVTPVPSSDAPDLPSSQEENRTVGEVEITLLSRRTSAKTNIQRGNGSNDFPFSSPSRRVCILYYE